MKNSENSCLSIIYSNVIMIVKVNKMESVIHGVDSLLISIVQEMYVVLSYLITIQSYVTFIFERDFLKKKLHHFSKF